MFGTYIVHWQRDRSIPLEAKRKAYGLVTVTFVVSILCVQAAWLRVMLVILGVGLLAFLAALPTAGGIDRPEDADDEPPRPSA
jgi:hypothetical protein